MNKALTAAGESAPGSIGSQRSGRRAGRHLRHNLQPSGVAQQEETLRGGIRLGLKLDRPPRGTN